MDVDLDSKKGTSMMNMGLDKSMDIVAEVLFQKQQLALQKHQQQRELKLKKHRQAAEKKRKELQLPRIKTPITSDRNGEELIKGKVRGTPYGAELKKPSALEKEGKMEEAQQLRDEALKWQKKMRGLPKITFPREGFDHTYSQSTVDFIDSIHDEKKQDISDHLPPPSFGDDYDDESDDDYGATKAAMAATFAADTSAVQASNDGREYGHEKSPLDAPVRSLKDKWRLLPHFLALRSLMRQHIDSFDHFVSVEMKQIVQSPSACEIRSDHDPKFYLRYEDCW